jgi:hypothetical protein
MMSNLKTQIISTNTAASLPEYKVFVYKGDRFVFRIEPDARLLHVQGNKEGLPLVGRFRKYGTGHDERKGEELLINSCKGCFRFIVSMPMGITPDELKLAKKVSIAALNKKIHLKPEDDVARPPISENILQ